MRLGTQGKEESDDDMAVELVGHLLQMFRSPAGVLFRHGVFGPCGCSFVSAGTCHGPLVPSWPDQITSGRCALASTSQHKTVDCLDKRLWQCTRCRSHRAILHLPRLRPRSRSADRMPTERASHKRPFAAWVKRLTNLHPSSKKAKKASQLKNNPYPQSGRLQQCRHESLTSHSASDNASLNVHHTRDSTTSRASSLSAPPVNSNRSQANTVATIPETIASDGGYFKSSTNGRGGALSSVDGAGHNSTFSSPNQSQQSLTTTLTTIQSTNNHLNTAQPHAHFSQQPPSAIPAHLAANTNNNNNPHNDNASILTLASSSKRRRRSMDTDASVRAIAPKSMWGDSRESLPLSLLSANIDHTSTRSAVGPLISAERASIYSSRDVSAPAIASDRNSYYAASHRQVRDRERDKESHRDRDFGADGRSINFDAKSLNFDGRSLGGDVASLRGYEGSVRSGALGHGRNDSIPSGQPSPMVGGSPLLRRPSGALTFSSDVRDKEDHEPAEHKNHA
jgi:hypothetical protein